MKNIATWIREVDEANFARVFSAYPDVQFWNARTQSVPWDRMQGLMLTGGSDISQPYLKQPVPNPKFIEDADPVRDVWEFEVLAKALELKMPLLGICRGLQVLNVALGGTLHLDIPHHDDAASKYGNIQALRYVEGTPIQFPLVNSSHHQALDKLGAGLKIQAWSVDGDIIEQVQLCDYPFGLAVQFHPERDPIYRALFDAFVQQVPHQTS